MKKTIIAAGASAVLAAMPVVGTFAASVASVQDKVDLTVQSTCTMDATVAEAGFNLVHLGSQAAGNAYGEQNGTPMTITCNEPSGWNITASATAMSDTASPAVTSQTIPFGAYAETSSIWSAKVTLSGNNTDNASVTAGWGDYTNPTATPVVAHVADTTGAKAVSGLVVTPSYKAYAAADQAAATYAGTITYTFNTGA